MKKIQQYGIVLTDRNGFKTSLKNVISIREDDDTFVLITVDGTEIVVIKENLIMLVKTNMKEN